MLLTLTLMASATMQTIVLEHSTLVVCAMVLATSTPADVPTFPQAIAIVTATYSTHVVFAEVPAFLQAIAIVTATSSTP